MNKKIYLEKILESFPGLKFKKATLITAGFDDDVIILDKRIVFSFPKKKLDCLEKFRKELKILPLLNKKISLRIPNFVYISDDESFAGYKYISGVPLTKNILKSLCLKKREACAKQIALFFDELHSISVEKFLRSKNSFLPVAKTRSKKIKYSLVHSDFIDEHILFDRKLKKIVGIIDFGDIQIGDPAIDFSKLLNYGEEFLDMVLEHSKTAGKDMKKRSLNLYKKFQK